MSNIQDSNNNKNISIKKEDNIMSVKPEAIKMDILLFKNDVLREIKQIEKGIIDKSKETNNILKNKITLFDNKMKFINDQISSMSNKMINGIKIEERINILSQAREQLLDETTTNKIKISMLEKEMRDSVNRIDDILKQDYTVIDTRQSDMRIYIDKCPTLRTGRHGILYVKNKQLHKLSGLEALLLQGFPKKYVMKAMGIPNSKLLSQAGNAMTVNVISAIGECLINYIEENTQNGFSSKRLSNC